LLDTKATSVSLSFYATVTSCVVCVIACVCFLIDYFVLGPGNDDDDDEGGKEKTMVAEDDGRSTKSAVTEKDVKIEREATRGSQDAWVE
jgi:tRNA(Arg) A34 adenosine deaminase TadA